MRVIRAKKGIGVIVEVMDIFNEIKGFEEIPDKSLERERYKKYEKEEFKAHERVIENLTEEYKKKGYRLVRFWTREEADRELKTPLSLGLNGVYLLLFKK